MLGGGAQLPLSVIIKCYWTFLYAGNESSVLEISHHWRSLAFSSRYLLLVSLAGSTHSSVCVKDSELLVHDAFFHDRAFSSFSFMRSFFHEIYWKLCNASGEALPSSLVFFIPWVELGSFTDFNDTGRGSLWSSLSQSWHVVKFFSLFRVIQADVQQSAWSEVYSTMTQVVPLIPDDLDTESNNHVMCCEDWFGCHSPEIANLYFITFCIDRWFMIIDFRFKGI